jgi:flavin-dependent dehydrogenase
VSFDLVVAGGSFAGLVLATSARGRVALIEKGEVGEGQTSACATTLDAIEKLGLEAATEAVHDTAVFHHRRGAVRFRLPYRLCTFDYRTFCRLLLERFDGELIGAAATGVRAPASGRAVVCTTRGDVEAGAVVDATGWRAVLACSADPWFPATAARSYGLEQAAYPGDPAPPTAPGPREHHTGPDASGFRDNVQESGVTGRGEGGLRFHFSPHVHGAGYGWAFPAGPVTRAGLLSYLAADGVRDATVRFLAAEQIAGTGWHGGYLPAGLRPPLAGPVFTLGDAAGHCLPLTAEGIRPAIYFAQRLAALLDREREGATRADTRAAWRALHAGHRRGYAVLHALQGGLRGWPDPPLGALFRWYAKEGGLYRWVGRSYWRLSAPIIPAPFGAHLAEASA